jgi:D-lyxose ketol-isomerase
MFVYLEGGDTMKNGRLVAGKEKVYTLRNEKELAPGEQLMLQPGEKHWFQAGREGAVLFSFSSVVRDALDGFTDPMIVRSTKIEED